MIDRHLLPDEIDLIVDGDVGFGVAPLRAHLRSCGECRNRVEEAREIVAALEELPHLAPSSLFADRVMGQVQVFEPWHVAARNTARRFVPRSVPARVAVALGGVAATFMLGVISIFAATRLDLVAFATSAAVTRARGVVATVVEAIVGATLGPTALDFIRATGAIGLATSLLFLLVIATIAVLGVRRLALASSRRSGGS